MMARKDETMARRSESATERAVFIISVAAELAGVHPQTLRIYERKGLVRPKRTSGNTRRYSQADIDRLLAIQELTDEGVNLAGRQAHHRDAAPRSTRSAGRCATSHAQLAHRRAIAMPGRRSVDIVPQRRCSPRRGSSGRDRLAGDRVTLRPYRDDEIDDSSSATWADADVVRPEGHRPA